MQSIIKYGVSYLIKTKKEKEDEIKPNINPNIYRLRVTVTNVVLTILT